MIALDAWEFRPNNPAALPPRIFSTAPGGKGTACSNRLDIALGVSHPFEIKFTAC
ncbi:MAG: hypothetical protein ABSG35_17325 [Syntrophobacteraceae bacterium]|jgi:hypothetical protein